MPEIIRGIEQGSPEWFVLCLGSAGGSSAPALLAKGQGKMRQTLLYKLAGEILTGKKTDGYQSDDMRRGNFYEPEARIYYEFLRNVDVETVALVKSNIDGIHVSPDGLIGTDGGIEIKTQQPHVYVETKDTEKVDIGYVRQCQHFLWVSERQWIDFCAYCPEIIHGEKMWIKRFERDEKMITELREQAEKFLTELNELVKRMGG